jgi:manganese/iron transport system permease protein
LDFQTGETLFSLAPFTNPHLPKLIFFAILVLAVLERRGRGLGEARPGTAYVVAAAVSILILSKNRYAELGWLDLLKGEVITISNFDLMLTAAVLALVIAVLILFKKELLLVSYDRMFAITLGKHVLWWDVLLYLLIGLTVSMAVLSVGPLIAFGFLFVPALTVHMLARNMRQLVICASLLGGTAAFVGFWLAYQWDFPVGPTDVALLGIIYGATFVMRKIINLGTANGHFGNAPKVLKR